MGPFPVVQVDELILGALAYDQFDICARSTLAI